MLPKKPTVTPWNPKPFLPFLSILEHMRFLLLSHIFPPAIDGGSSHLYSIGKCLEKHKHQVFYVSSNSQSSDDFIGPRIFKLIHPILSKGPIFRILPFLRALSTIRRFQPDYIIAGPFPTTISLYARFIQKITQAKLILVPCFHPTDSLFSHSSLIETLRQANYILTLTDFEKKYLSTHFNIDSQKLKIIPSGIPSALLKKTPATFPHKPNVLYIGSFSAHKGINALIRSIPQNCTLTLAGQKTLYWPQIKKQIKSLPTPIQKNIKTIFNFPSSRLPQIIDSCTCLVLPSTQESFGKVLLEAWARKKPVIVKNTPAPVELVNRSRGGLVVKNNLRQSILKLINNPSLCRRLGQNGYHFVKKNHTWDRIGQHICQKLSL